MKSTIRTLVLGLIFWVGCGLEASWAYVSDSNVYPASNYYTFQLPLVGGSYADPVFGTAIRRITDAASTANPDGGNLIFITGEYSTMSPFNLDNSRILVQYNSGYNALLDSSGSFLGVLPAAINSSSEPRWSRSDPNLLYYHVGNQLKQHNISTGATSVVHTFSTYSTITGNGESDISHDGNHFVFAGDGRFVFVYELSTDTIGPVLDTGGRGFDSLYLTPNNNVTISWHQPGTSRYTGIELFDRNLNFQRQVAHAGGHMDVTRDTNGDEVLVWTNSADASPLPGCNNGLVKIRLADAQQTCLLSLDWSLAVHVSGTDDSGWVFVETYAPSDPDPLSSGWRPYTNEILQIKLDGTEVRRLAHHRSRPFNSYNWTPRLSASRDGSRLIYNSNYGLQGILDYPSEYSDVYLVLLSGTTNPTGSAPSLTTSSLPSGTQNTAYSATLTATGGTTPYTWSILSGNLPTGLTLGSSTGIVSGTPTGTGTNNFTAQVTDIQSQTATKALSITINAGTSATIQQDNAAVSYNGAWFPNSLSVHSGGTAVLAMDSKDTATISFTGTGVSWIGYRDAWSGIALVYVDGKRKAKIDTYSSADMAQSVIYSVSGLSAGNHTLKIQVTGQKNRSSGGAWVWVDAFQVKP